MAKGDGVIILAVAAPAVLGLVLGLASRSSTAGPIPGPVVRGRRILIVGDSLSLEKYNGKAVSSPGAQLAKLFRAEGAEVKVHALGGRSMLSFRQGSTNGETAGGLVQLENLINLFVPDWVLFLLGTNDEANIAAGGQTVKKALEAWQEVINFVLQKKVPVIIVGPPAFAPELSIYTRANGSKHNIPEVEPAFIAGLSSLGVPFIDSRPLTSDLTSKKDRPVEKKSGRAIHFTTKAGTLWAQRLYEALTGDEAPSLVKLSRRESVNQWRDEVQAELDKIPDDDPYKPSLALVLALMDMESGGDPDVVSWADAEGLMQLMPGTSDMFKVPKFYNPKAHLLGGKPAPRKGAFDPIENIRGGIKTLQWIMPQFDETDPDYWKRVLAGYNAGPGNIPKKGDVPRADYWGYILPRVPLYEEEKAKEADD